MDDIYLETAMQHKIFQIGLFEKTSNESAECVCCRKQGIGKYKFILSKGSVKSLIVHLMSSLHSESEFVKKYKDLNELKSEDKIDKFIINNSEGITKLDKKVLNLICENNLPFNIINKKSFRILFKQTSEKLLSESHYRKVLPEIYKIVKQKLRKELNECQYVSCTTDCWTGPTENFMSLTASGITEEWNKKRFVLSIRKFSEAHTGKNMANLLRTLIGEWGLENNINCFVTDGARNVQKAFEELPYDQVLCAAHQINLIVRNSIVEKESEIAKLFS